MRQNTSRVQVYSRPAGRVPRQDPAHDPETAAGDRCLAERSLAAGAGRDALSLFFSLRLEFLQAGVDGPMKVDNITCPAEEKTADKATTLRRDSSLAIW